MSAVGRRRAGKLTSGKDLDSSKGEIIHLETYLPLTEASGKISSLKNTGHLAHVEGANGFNAFVHISLLMFVEMHSLHSAPT